MDKSYIHELLKPTHGPGCTCSWHAPEPEPSPTQDGAGDGSEQGEAAESNGKKSDPTTTASTTNPTKKSGSQEKEQEAKSQEDSTPQGQTQNSSPSTSQSGNQSDDNDERSKDETPKQQDSGTSESETQNTASLDSTQSRDSQPQESECTPAPSTDSEGKRQTGSSTSSTTDENSPGSQNATPSTSDEQTPSQAGGESDDGQTNSGTDAQSSELDQSSTSTEQDSTSTENDDPKAQPQSGDTSQDGGSSSPGAGTPTPVQPEGGGCPDTSGSQETGGTSADQAPEQSNSTQQNTTNETQTSEQADSDSAYTPPSAMTATITMSSQDQEALAEMLSEKSDNADYEAEIAALARQYPEFQEQGTKFDMNDLRDLEDRDIDMGKIENETWRSTNYKQNLAWGGDYRRPDMVRKAFAQPVTKDLARALHRMIDNEVGSGIYESQRIDGGKLIAQMQSKQLNLTRCRREEMHREKLLILCDISVSCDAVCNQMTAAAYRIIDLDPRLNIIFHSNNSLLEITGQDVDTYVVDQLTKINVMTGIRGGKEASKQETAEAWRELLSYLSTKTVLVFGDCDAVHTYEQIIASGVRFFYLGNGRVSGESFYSSGGYNYGYGQAFENKYPEAQIIATMGGAYNPQKALDEVVAYLSKGTGRIDNGVRIG